MTAFLPRFAFNVLFYLPFSPIILFDIFLFFSFTFTEFPPQMTPAPKYIYIQAYIHTS